MNNYIPLKTSKKIHNPLNSFKQKSTNITGLNPLNSKKKAHSPYMYNTFYTNDNININQNNYHNNNQNKFLNSLPINANPKSNSLDKASKYKFGQYNNFSKHYCITLNQYAQYKKDFVSLNSLNSQSSSNNKNRGKISRPSTAPQKKQKVKNKNLNENKNDFIGFSGITNIRTNLISVNNNKGVNNNKFKIKNNNKDYGFNNLFNPSNTFTNNMYINTIAGFNNKFIENNNEYNKALFGANNKRIISPKIYSNHSTNKNKKQIRLNSPIDNIPLVNNYNQSKRKY